MNDSDSPEPSPEREAASLVAVLLSGRQLRLLKALAERSEAVASMYMGSLRVLADITNPDRLPLCAHGIRELMEKLHEHLDVPTSARKESLGGKVRELHNAFEKMRKHCLCAQAGWTGPVDGHLQKFLVRFDTFAEWFLAHHPRRREEVRGVLERLDGSGRSLPQPLASLNVDAWVKTRDFFISVAHHRHITNDVEMSQWLTSFERFLLDYLVPRTFDDLKEIDELLAEDDGHA